MRKVERKVGRKFEPFSIWKLATTELKLNHPEAQKTHFAPKNSLRENSEKRETSRKIREKFEKNSRAVFQNYECCKNHCGHKINSEYSLRLRSGFAPASRCIRPTLSCSWTAKKLKKLPLKTPFASFCGFQRKGRNIHIFTSRDCGIKGNQKEIRRSGAGVEQWKAQNERRVQTVLPAFLLHSSLELLSCSPALLNFFTFFYIPNGYWSRTSFFRT